MRQRRDALAGAEAAQAEVAFPAPGALGGGQDVEAHVLGVFGCQTVEDRQRARLEFAGNADHPLPGFVQEEEAAVRGDHGDEFGAVLDDGDELPALLLDFEPVGDVAADHHGSN